MKKSVLLTLVALVLTAPALVQARSSQDRLNSLGGNKDLIRKARALDPDNRVRVVQKRSVDRHWRLEAAFNYGMLSGGDPYLTTNSLGANVDLHITPRWSVGVRYQDFRNELTAEGERVFQAYDSRAALGDTSVAPAVDYPDSSTVGVVNFYPLYGKLNLFDMGIAQFDLYVLAGYGQMKLKSGATPTWTAGGGVGMWLSQHIASRLEVRHQSYEDQIYTGAREESALVTSFSIGFLL